MDIVVKGRNVEVPEHFRVHVAEKLSRAERYDPKLNRVEVELVHEGNPRQAKSKQRVQVTVTGRGPTVRAEAAAETFYAALDLAADKLEGRLRKLRGRRLARVSARVPLKDIPIDPDAQMPGVAGVQDGAVGGSRRGSLATVQDEFDSEFEDEFAQDDGQPGRIVRIKDHPADPITVDEALFQMELVGHDFYLFNDADTGLASVVYRRKGFDYGLLRLA